MSPAPFSSTQIAPSTDVIQQNAPGKRNNYTPQQGRRIPYASPGGGYPLLPEYNKGFPHPIPHRQTEYYQKF